MVSVFSAIWFDNGYMTVSVFEAGFSVTVHLALCSFVFLSPCTKLRISAVAVHHGRRHSLRGAESVFDGPDYSAVPWDYSCSTFPDC